MTDETTNADLPEADGPAFEGVAMSLSDLLGGPAKPNLVPLTAHGVSELLEATRLHVSAHARAETGFIQNPETGTMVPVIRTPTGGVDFIPMSKFDAYEEGPTFRKGAASMKTLDSFIDHVNRFGDADSAVFVNDDASNPSLLAVLNYHRKDSLSQEEGEDRIHGDYRHGDHKTAFAFPLSEEWKFWLAHNGQSNAMDMLTFSNFIEDRIGDIALVEDGVPDGVERFVELNGGAGMIASYGQLHDLAHGLQVSEGHHAEQKVNHQNGAGKVSFTTVVENTKVNGVEIIVPAMFFIAIPVFHKGAYYRIAARLRYRVAGGKVVFWYDLWRADRSFDHAIAEAAMRVDAETEAQVFFGSPEA